MKTLVASIAAWGFCLHLGRAAEPSSGSVHFLETVRTAAPAAIRAQLEEGASVSAEDASGNTPLHLAALRGDANSVELLLKAGAAVNATNGAGATPLLYGAHNARVVRQLLEHGADPNIASMLGSTPIMAAVVRPESFEAVRELVEHGADMRARRSWAPPGQGSSGLGGGEQALVWAIAGGDRRTIDFLIDRAGPKPGSPRPKRRLTTNASFNC